MFNLFKQSAKPSIWKKNSYEQFVPVESIGWLRGLFDQCELLSFLSLFQMVLNDFNKKFFTGFVISEVVLVDEEHISKAISSLCNYYLIKDDQVGLADTYLKMATELLNSSDLRISAIRLSKYDLNDPFVYLTGSKTNYKMKIMNVSEETMYEYNVDVTLSLSEHLFDILKLIEFVVPSNIQIEFGQTNLTSTITNRIDLTHLSSNLNVRPDELFLQPTSNLENLSEYYEQDDQTKQFLLIAIDIPKLARFISTKDVGYKISTQVSTKNMVTKNIDLTIVKNLQMYLDEVDTSATSLLIGKSYNIASSNWFIGMTYDCIIITNHISEQDLSNIIRTKYRIQSEE